MTCSLLLFLALTTAAAPQAASAARVALVPFASSEGLARLARSPDRVDFGHLANAFEGQENIAFCGVASSVIVLNALRDRDGHFEKPKDDRLLPKSWGVELRPGLELLYHRYTQGDFFTPETDAVKRRDEVLGQPRTPGAPRDGGLQLRQLAQLLAVHGVAVQLRVADDALNAAAIKRELIENLSTENDYALVNYSRAAVGQPGGGHISPLGAYDPGSDSFLVLDVNPNTQPWVWVPAAALIKGMQTRDVAENRGYLLVKEGPAPLH